MDRGGKKWKEPAFLNVRGEPPANPGSVNEREINFHIPKATVFGGLFVTTAKMSPQNICM